MPPYCAKSNRCSHCDFRNWHALTLELPHSETSLDDPRDGPRSRTDEGPQKTDSRPATELDRWPQVHDASGMKLLVARLGLLALSIPFQVAAQHEPSPEQLRDPVTGRKIQRYASSHHETHHYYFVSPWSPDGSQIVFFQFDRSVEKLTATGRYPGVLVVMNSDGTARRKLAGPLTGHYHTGVNQLWGPEGNFVYFQSRDPGPRCMARVPAAGGSVECVETPVPCSRLSPDGSLLSCGNAEHQGVLELQSGSYRQLAALAEARNLTPNRLEIEDEASQLQNARFSPDGESVAFISDRSGGDALWKMLSLAG